MAEPIFFEDQEAWRAWLRENHDTEDEVELGFWKVKLKKPGLTYKQAVDEALCFGWIDGIRHSMGAESHRVRFTPRRKGSIWSQVNLKRYAELEAAGRVHASGRARFEGRDPKKENLYSFEVRRELEGEELEALQKDGTAAEFWEKTSASYRQEASWWVLQAKRDETRKKRLARLIEYSVRGEKLPDAFASKPKA